MTLWQMLVFLVIYWLNYSVPVQSELVDEELPPELHFLLEKEKWDVHGHPLGEQEVLTSDFLQGESQHHSSDDPNVLRNDRLHERTSKESDVLPSRGLLANMYREHIRSSLSNFPEERKPMLMGMNPKFDLDLDLEKLKKEPLNNYMRHHSARHLPSTISTLKSRYQEESMGAWKEVHNRALNLHESGAYPASVHAVRKVDYEKLERERGRSEDHKKRPAASKQPTSKQFEKSHRSELPRGLPHLHIMPLFASGRQGNKPKLKSVYTFKVDKSETPITNIFQLLK